jgi:hypothetical protein
MGCYVSAGRRNGGRGPGASHFPPPDRSERSRKDTQEPHRLHVPKQGAGPGTIHTAAAIGARHSSHRANVRRPPVRQRQVLRSGARYRQQLIEEVR